MGLYYDLVQRYIATSMEQQRFIMRHHTIRQNLVQRLAVLLYPVLLAIDFALFRQELTRRYLKKHIHDVYFTADSKLTLISNHFNSMVTHGLSSYLAARNVQPIKEGAYVMLIFPLIFLHTLYFYDTNIPYHVYFIPSNSTYIVSTAWVT